MSVSGISNTSSFNAQTANPQNQPQWQQEFRKLSQDLQSEGFGSSGAIIQTTVQAKVLAAQAGSQTIANPTPQSTNPGSLLFGEPTGTPKHSLHLRRPHHLEVGAGNNSEKGSNALTDIAIPGNALSAQQAFNSWQQNFQQVALNSDLLTAQSADWQPVSLNA